MLNEEITTTIYFFVENGGDGSAFPKFFDSKELRDWCYYTYHESSGIVFQESCGSLVFNGPSKGTARGVLSSKSFFLKYIIDEWNYRKEDPSWIRKVQDFLSTFMKEYPKWKVLTERGSKDYLYNQVSSNGEKIDRLFLKKEHSGPILEHFLNNFQNLLKGLE